MDIIIKLYKIHSGDLKLLKIYLIVFNYTFRLQVCV